MWGGCGSPPPRPLPAHIFRWQPGANERATRGFHLRYAAPCPSTDRFAVGGFQLRSEGRRERAQFPRQFWGELLTSKSNSVGRSVGRLAFLPVLGVSPRHRVFGTLPLSRVHDVPTASGSSMPVLYGFAHSSRFGAGSGRNTEVAVPGILSQRLPTPLFVLPSSGRAHSHVALSVPSYVVVYVKGPCCVLGNKVLEIDKTLSSASYCVEQGLFISIPVVYLIDLCTGTLFL